MEEESEMKERHNLTRQAITKLVKDFHESLRSTLDRLGDCSNAEKHVNELIHRANFRFSDLQVALTKAKEEIVKCSKLANIVMEQSDELLKKETSEYPE